VVVLALALSGLTCTLPPPRALTPRFPSNTLTANARPVLWPARRGGTALLRARSRDAVRGERPAQLDGDSAVGVPAGRSRPPAMTKIILLAQESRLRLA